MKQTKFLDEILNRLEVMINDKIYLIEKGILPEGDNNDVDELIVIYTTLLDLKEEEQWITRNTI